MGEEVNMAIEDWINWDVDSDDYDSYHEDTPFKCGCKWCGKEITMTPTEDGWRPMFRGKLHICDARKDAQAKALLALMPDLSLPECQFCGTNMVWCRGELDPEETWPIPHFILECPKCGATGPRVEHGHPEYRNLLETVK